VPQIRERSERIIEEHDAQPGDQTVVTLLRRCHCSHVGNFERHPRIVCAIPSSRDLDQRR
jgi:hypothetical protein